MIKMAKKYLGVKPYLFPMPVLMIATYCEDGSVDVMNMAWGGICDNNKVALNITESHKTSQNIKERGAFTISVADIPHLRESDFFGTASGNRMKDKFERSGMHAVKSERVDAPIIEEYPITLECKVDKIQKDEDGFRVVGEIVNVLADESVLDDNGKVDPTKLNAFVFDQFQNGYYAIGEKVGEAWKSGNKYMK
ncbi:MAG TPA: flavin reductase family protein [Candidatus Onthousia excrementipullorum]|uniref:Flavin reductase family protein n=1 Tax=Candidatus Onthousia excrementipullorum TaxID=2840884 RepID=A0A9D1DTJ6_9FIRM|nr:flavin reductase family protein [Candidatus Onthousia excrementipullorum]